MHDLDDIFKVLGKDRFQINIETGEVINLDEVLEEVRKEKSYLFQSIKKKPCTIKYRAYFLQKKVITMIDNQTENRINKMKQ